MTASGQYLIRIETGLNSGEVLKSYRAQHCYFRYIP